MIRGGMLIPMMLLFSQGMILAYLIFGDASCDLDPLQFLSYVKWLENI